MKLIKLISVFFFVFIAPIAAAQAFKEGVHYEVLDFEVSKDKEVVEFFSYSCPGCYKFDPYIESFLNSKPANVKFSRVPVHFGRKPWKFSARAFVIAKALKMEEKLTSKIFNRVQGSKGAFLNDKDLKQFFLQQGVTEEQFNIADKSFSTKVLEKSLNKKVKKYAISSVPTVIVNGKYHVLLQKKQSKKDFKRLVAHLVNMDR